MRLMESAGKFHCKGGEKNGGYYFIYICFGNSESIVIHMLEAMRDNPAEWYLYDFTMGTLKTPKAITCKEDLEGIISEWRMTK